jgi:hypothetical protein
MVLNLIGLFSPVISRVFLNFNLPFFSGFCISLFYIQVTYFSGLSVSNGFSFSVYFITGRLAAHLFESKREGDRIHSSFANKLSFTFPQGVNDEPPTSFYSLELWTMHDVSGF